MRVGSWITSVILGLIAILGLAGVGLQRQDAFHFSNPLLLSAAMGCLLVSAGLLFPPIWLGDKAKHSKRPRIIATIILAGTGLLTTLTQVNKLDGPVVQGPVVDMPVPKDIK